MMHKIVEAILAIMKTVAMVLAINDEMVII